MKAPENSGIKKTYVLIGSYGSGKTELALNIALRAAKREKVLLVDLDMVNTYFRLSERGDLIGASGVSLVSPNYIMTNIESLSLPASVQSAFDSDWDTVVFDAGGDSAGATALGSFKARFSNLDKAGLEVLHVTNIRRPLSATPEKIISQTLELEQKSRLQVTGFINNTNLAAATGRTELRDGYEVLRRVSEETGIPVSYTAGKKKFLDVFLSEGYDKAYIGSPIEIVTYMRRDWDSFVKNGV